MRINLLTIHMEKIVQFAVLTKAYLMLYNVYNINHIFERKITLPASFGQL